MLVQADQGRTLFLSIRWRPSLTTLEGALLDCHDWICRKNKSVTGESSLRKGQELRKHREIPRWRWGRGYAILVLIKLTAFDRKKEISHIFLSSCRNLLLSSACSILNFLHPCPPSWTPQLFQILSEMSSKNFEIVWWGFITVWPQAPLEPTSESVFGVTCLWQNICEDSFRADAFSWIVASASLVHHDQLHPIWIHDRAKWWQRHRSVAAHIRVDGNQSQGQEESRAR